ncbi:hypothetical protein [Novosphingobium beihaiensis]|uniref:Phage abortive infection protein n=1 Tax=Novosphingobium beihaiensis TaxID=2930389 RepID=A0ABT0BQJ5_9SPHN|nr:hypothetical protein [Novosphingobium beihaiensis]MCJ2187337.1 hypothetical protein [Novosphingobium beihaiensis]
MAGLAFVEKVGQTVQMNNLLRFFGGVLLSSLIVVITISRLAVEVIGASTAPDDYDVLKRRMPAMLSWLFSTPWWAPTALLFGGAGIAAWLIWTATKSAAAKEMEHHSALDEKAIKNTVAAAIDELIATRIQSELSMHSQDERLVKLESEIRDASSVAKSAVEIAGNRFENIGMDIRSLEDQIAATKRQWDEWTHQHCRNQDQRFSWVDAGFTAILHRERLTVLAEKIEVAAEVLLAPRNGGTIDNWDNWATIRLQWQSDLSGWLELADIHRTGVSDKVLNISGDALEGNWPEPDGIFPDATTALAYRRVAKTFDVFRSERDMVDRAVIAAAYGNPSMMANPRLLKSEDL